MSISCFLLHRSLLPCHTRLLITLKPPLTNIRSTMDKKKHKNNYVWPFLPWVNSTMTWLTPGWSSSSLLSPPVGVINKPLNAWYHDDIDHYTKNKVMRSWHTRTNTQIGLAVLTGRRFCGSLATDGFLVLVSRLHCFPAVTSTCTTHQVLSLPESTNLPSRLTNHYSAPRAGWRNVSQPRAGANSLNTLIFLVFCPCEVIWPPLDTICTSILFPDTCNTSKPWKQDNNSIIMKNRASISQVSVTKIKATRMSC